MKSMNENRNLKKGVGIHARRFIAYVVLAIVSVLCLFWFYVLFINATRSNGELQSGFTLIPSSHLWENWKNLRNGTLPVWNGMINSLIVSSPVSYTHLDVYKRQDSSGTGNGSR